MSSEEKLSFCFSVLVDERRRVTNFCNNSSQLVGQNPPTRPIRQSQSFTRVKEKARRINILPSLKRLNQL